MWILSKHPVLSENTDVSQFFLLAGRKYVIGRKDCDIILPGDASISRKHAEITIGNTDLNDVNKTTEILIVDTSKIGICVNGGKLTPKISKLLKIGDVVSFGKSLKYRLDYKSYIGVMSCINSHEVKTKIKANIHKLGGHMLNDWRDEATHLIMEKLTFTIKVVCTLACGKPVVTPKFFEDLLDCCDKKKGNKLPSEKNYLPPIAEDSLMNLEYLFGPNTNRNTLLVGKLFVSLAPKQYKRIKQAVQFAGGSILLKDEIDLKLVKEISSNQMIVLQAESKDEKLATEEQNTWMKHIYAKLSSHHLRTIRESEIGLAILHMSIQSFCNPTTKKAPSVIDTSHTQVLTDTMMETQPNSQFVTRKEHMNQNSMENRETDFTKKRKRPDEQIVQSLTDNNSSQVFKKTKVERKGHVLKPSVTESSAISSNIINIDGDNDGDLFIADHKENSFVNQNNSRNDKITHISGTADIIEKSYIGNTLTSVFSEKPGVNSQILNTKKTGILVQNTANSSLAQNSKQNSSSNLLFTPQSRKAIPNTFSCLTNNVLLQHDDDNEEEEDPFSFNLSECSGQRNISDIINNVVKDNEGLDPDSLKIEDQNILFTKNKTSLHSRTEILLDESYKNNSVLLDKENVTSHGCNVASFKKQDTSTKPNSQKKQNLSYLVNDDDNLVSEEFLPPEKNAVLLKGFISVINKKSTAPVIKDDPDLIGTPKNLLQTSFVPLVKPKEKTTAPKSCASGVKKPKNFKCFKKQWLIDDTKKRSAMIQRNNLVAFETENTQRESLFDELREENEEEERKDQEMDNMLSWRGNNNKSTSRRNQRCTRFRSRDQRFKSAKRRENITSQLARLTLPEFSSGTCQTYKVLCFLFLLFLLFYLNRWFIKVYLDFV